MDVSALRADIKAWERQFKAQNGRDPTVQDIKDTPDMPNKYKLYKKLSKQSASNSSASQLVSTDRPSTPPKSHSRQPRPSASSIIPKPRVVKTDGSVLTDNPFSPAKDKGKQKALFSDSLPIASSSRVNPFATPRKAKHKPHALRRDPSPEPFPLIQQPQTPSYKSSSALLRPSVPATSVHRDSPTHVYKDTTVTRARKRLRGEPVSPSPVKEKRARVFSQSSTTFVRHNTLLGHSDISGDEDTSHEAEETPVDVEEAFFFNSPVKRPNDGKHFKLLFDETPMMQQDIPARPPRQALSRTRSTIAAGPFGGEPKKGRGGTRALSPDTDDDSGRNGPRDSGEKIKALDLSLNGKPERKKPFNNGFPRAVLPGKDDLWNAAPMQNGTHPPSSISTNGTKTNKDVAQAARKRSLPDDSMLIDDGLNKGQDTPQLQLLPPSPPPPGTKSSSRYGEKGKGKGVPAGSRKKAKLLEELVRDDQDDLDDDDNDAHVKEVAWSWNAHTTGKDGDIPIDPTAGADSEPEFDPTVYRPAPIVAPLDSPNSGEFEVSLPDDLKRVLALSPHHSQKQDLDEERVARELLYGRRETHYDPNRGGEIWDVGEVSDEAEKKVKKTTNDEDEWEGEPVPWEVGEL